MTKFELKGIGVILIAVCIILVGIGIWRTADNRQLVVNVEQNSKTVATLPLRQDTKKTIHNHFGTNIITIKNGKARVTKADCKNQICVNSRAISEKGETIACLPHKLVLTVMTKGQVAKHGK